ncbi:hypothetical protein QE152_g24775 [Popillia japonica]|uniref:Uncharacterized protein n=1 Tax=Popillia japonica TaxID=7064 RepID=A0AAW1K4P4_POPJA
MTDQHFDDLLAKVTIRKNDTAMCEALPPRLKLEITIRYLASGNSFKKTLEAIYYVLHEYIKSPLLERECQ